MQKRLVLVLILIVISAMPLQAWGPMTHLAVNTRGYKMAADMLRNTLCIPPDLANVFIGGGPCPDIKQPGGADFPPAFHADVDTIVRMIDLAKTNERYGLLDVVEALGWAGHLFAEVTTAHAPDGYPNNKITMLVPGAEGINHQINELAVDILTFDTMHDELAKRSLIMPMRLLEASMAAERAKNPSLKAMSAEKIRQIANDFQVSVWGIKTIAEYLRQARPELIEEMRDFHADREEAVDASVREVVRLLKTYGTNDFTKKTRESADGAQKISLPVNDDFKSKVKAFGWNALGKLTKSDRMCDIFTSIGGGLLKFAISTNLTRGQLKKVAGSIGAGSIWGDPRHKIIVQRYVEGLLLHQDKTYTEIIAWAQEGFDPDPTNRAKQKKQFAAKKLSDDGRKKPSLNEVMAAVLEVERIETVRKNWPVFWPWRPGDVDLAVAREKAGRLLAFFVKDQNPAGSSLVGRANAMLTANHNLRSTIWAYRWESIFSPLKKWNNFKDVGKASEEFGVEQRFFVQLTRLSANGNMGQQQVDGLIQQTTQALQTKEAALARLRVDLKALTVWHPIKKDKVKSDIKTLEQDCQGLQETLKALQQIKETPSASGSVAAAPTNESFLVSSEFANLSPREIQSQFEKTYREYAGLLGQKKPDDPQVISVMKRLRELEQARSAALAENK